MKRVRGFGGSPKPPKVDPVLPAPPPPPQLTDPAIQEARRRQIEQARRNKGRAATVQTSPGGLDLNTNSARKTLLGN